MGTRTDERDEEGKLRRAEEAVVGSLLEDDLS